MTYIEQSQAAGRHIFPDLARAFALLGIAPVNVTLISYPMMQGFTNGGLATHTDEAAYFAVNALFSMKSYTLFSFMFGVGFAYQMKSAERQNVDFSSRYWRRIFGLLFLGLLHVAFLFQGDILVIYALLGSFLFLFKDMSGKRLIKWGIGLYVCQIVILGLTAGLMSLVANLAPEALDGQTDFLAEMAAAERAAFVNGTFSQTIMARFTDWAQVITNGLFVQGLGALSFFVLGLAAVRLDTIARPDAAFWRKCRLIYLPIGLIGSAYAAYIFGQVTSPTDPAVMTGAFFLVLFSPFSTAGYLGLLAKWSAGPPSGLKIFFARAGTASLTAYLMQGLLFSLIFNGYGLGLYEQYGAAICIAIAFGVGLFTLVFSSLWRIYFARGPMEALLRRWTYRGARG